MTSHGKLTKTKVVHLFENYSFVVDDVSTEIIEVIEVWLKVPQFKI
jgi:hypothetical protein